MADEDENSEAAAAPKGGGKKKLIILGSILLTLIILSIVGTIVALNMFSGAEDEMLEAELVEEKAPEAQQARKPAVYYPLKPPIIVNFQARGRQRFLQADITLMMRDEMVVQAIETHMPMLRNALVLLFSGQVYEDLQTAEGKERLREESLAELQRLLQQEIGKPGVEQVLFTNFVMQ